MDAGESGIGWKLFPTDQYLVVYYDPKTGEPTRPMPRDPHTMKTLLEKGFTLAPPPRRKTKRRETNGVP